jgi:hypothetical protein
VSGQAGKWLVANSPILVTPQCTYQAEWNAHVCPDRYVRLSFNSQTAEAVAPVTVVRDDAVSELFSGGGNSPDNASLSAIPGRGYTLQWSASAPTQPKLYLNSAQPGDAIRLALPYAAAPGQIIRDYWAGNPMTAAASVAEVDASSGDKFYYDVPNGVLHLKLTAQAGNNWATLFVKP